MSEYASSYLSRQPSASSVADKHVVAATTALPLTSMVLTQSPSQWSHTSLVLPLPGGASWISLLAFSEPDTVLNITSLESVSFTGSAPIFPSEHRPPLFTLVGYENQNHWVAEDAIQKEWQEPIVITTPTTPRMKVILEEKVLVNKWMVPLEPPPDHVPWGDLEATSLEGNCPLTHSPRNQIEEASRISTPNTRWLRRKDPAPDPGSAIILPFDSTSNGESTMPPYSTRPRIVRNGSQEAIRKTLPLNTQETQRSCHFSFHPITPKKCSNLAIRRGHNAFPCLKLQQVTAKTDATLFDAIPTAFRGSPLTSSLVFDQTQYPPPQNISLAEMLGNLRAKCASFSSRVSLPPDWLHWSRPLSSEIMKLPDTVSTSHSGDDEWAFAEPLMDMINSFSGRGDDLNTHPILIKDGMFDIPIDSRGLYDAPSTHTIVLANNDAEESLGSPDFQVGPLVLRPSLIIPSSVCKPSSRSKPRKTVRFADSVTLPGTPVRLSPGKADKKNPPTIVGPPRHRRGQSISFSALIPPSPALSVVRSLQSSTPARSSQTNSSRNIASESQSRPLPHRFPRSPKLPLSMDENLIPRSLDIPHPKLRTHKRESGTAGYSLSPSSVSRPSHASGYLRFKFKGKKARIPGGNLRISAPLPMGTAIPLPKKKYMGVRRGHGKDNVTAPLRSIFMKLK